MAIPGGFLAAIWLIWTYNGLVALRHQIEKRLEANRRAAQAPLAQVFALVENYPELKANQKSCACRRS